MSVRLNKVTKEFNIGLQTAVEFLQKKGFTEVEANPNYKISDEQFSLLQQEFSTDKGLRTEAKMLIQQRQEQTKERKKPVPVVEDYVDFQWSAAGDVAQLVICYLVSHCFGSFYDVVQLLPGTHQ